MRRIFEEFFKERDIITPIRQCCLRLRGVTSSSIIIAKILYSIVSIGAIRFYMFLFEKFIEKVEVEITIKGINEVEVQKKVLWLIIIGWFLTSVRIWLFNRTAWRLSNDGVEFAQRVQRWGRRSYWDLFPVYVINSPFLIISVYLIILKIFPLLFKKPLLPIQMYIFALILGFAIDGIWEIFKRIPEIFTRR